MTKMGHQRQGGRLMISREPGAPGRARVIGSLTGDGIRIVLDAVQSGVAILDLSEVDQVDESGVRALTALPTERCTLVSCPRWLELWMVRVRAEAASERARRI